MKPGNNLTAFFITPDSEATLARKIVAASESKDEAILNRSYYAITHERLISAVGSSITSLPFCPVADDEIVTLTAKLIQVRSLPTVYPQITDHQVGALTVDYRCLGAAKLILSSSGYAPHFELPLVNFH